MSTPVVLFDDTVALVIGAINDGFADADLDVPVDNAVPDNRPDEFVVVRRQGGPRTTVVTDSAQIRVECYAQTRERAHDLAQYARAYMFGMRSTVRSGVNIYRVGEFAGPAELPDPITQRPRYVFTHLVATRGRSIDTPPISDGDSPTPGASRRGQPVVRAFPFAFDTPDLLTGAALYNPTPGDILLDAWIEIDTAWDGGPARADLGTFIGTDAGILGLMGPSTWNLDFSADATPDGWFSCPVNQSLAAFGAIATLGNRYSASEGNLVKGDPASFTFSGVPVVPARFTTDDAIKVCVSQDGTSTGTDPGSTQGAAILYLVTATPV